MPERRWSVRRLLAEGVAAQLNEAGDDALAAAIDQALLLTNFTLQTSKRAGLDLIESFMVPLNDRNDLSKRLLPQILVDTAKAFEINSCSAFNAASEAFIDKIPLLDDNVLQKLQKELIETIISDKMEVITDDMRIYKMTVKNILELFKHMDVEEIECSEINIKTLYVAVQAHKLGVECLVNRLAAPNVMQQALGIVVDTDDWFQVDTFFIFLKQFSDALLEHNGDRVIQVIADIIPRLDSETIKRVQKSLKSCVRVYSKKSSEQQQVLDSKVNEYCSRAPLEEITKDLKQNIFNPGHIDQVLALNVITDLGCSLDETNKSFIRQWPRLLFKMWNQGMQYPTDLLNVAVRSLTQAEVKSLIINGQGIVPEGCDDIIKFCRVNMCVFFEYLVRKPFLLGENDVTKCGVLLNDVVQWYVRRKCPLEWSDAILDLVDQLWSSYESLVSFERKVALLQDMRRLPTALPPDSAPMRWAVQRMTQGDVAEMISLVAVLPPGEAYKESFCALAALLPTRLRELSGESNSVFRALVDAAADGDHTLLEIIAKLASGDDTAGWWDAALECCAASVAARADRAVYELLQRLAWNCDSLGACHRLYLPLLRHSSSQFLEEYLPGEVVKGLGFLERTIKPTPVFAYREQVKRCAVVFSTIQVAMEKLSSTTLEQGTSPLNSGLGAPQPWRALRDVLTRSVDYLLRTVCPAGADTTLQDSCRQAQCAAFACACAALRRRAPPERAYGALFEPTLWSVLLDPHATHDLPLPDNYVVRKVRHTVSIEEGDAAGVAGSAARRAGTLTGSTHRSRLFLRTLSQNPLEYDKEPAQDEAPGEQEVEVRASWLNSLRVSRDVTALLRHAAARRLHAPRRLADALCGRGQRNAKLMLAQVVCNCSAELAQYADALRPALLQLVAEINDEPFNSLHLDILTTLSQWRDNISPSDKGHLQGAVVSLMLAILNNRHRKYTQDILMECMNKLLEVYGSMVSVEWPLIERYFHHEDEDMYKTCLKMLHKFTKNNVYIEGMVEVIIAKLNEQGGVSAELSALLGAALRVRAGDATLHNIESLMKKCAHVEFIKTLYYMQMECDRCCTFNQFKKLILLYGTVPASEKKKCLRIMASFLSGPCSRNSDLDIFKKLHLQDYIKNTDDEDIIALSSFIHIIKNTSCKFPKWRKYCNLCVYCG
ncbi:hypothetical protein O3G_MSEX012472 [Manduca sexta]|uniref:DNA-dependent protein kinase catalytic subunit CC3 domain-containing protein n=1 Tax=Manduca sexta TaxID=7130 RepID=A0A922CWR6_MANSE|nr:hypothetical protein O3G_MSEX012472 [Manduca sexta]